MKFIIFAATVFTGFPLPPPPLYYTHTHILTVFMCFGALERSVYVLFSLETKHKCWRKLVSCAQPIPELLYKQFCSFHDQVCIYLYALHTFTVIVLFVQKLILFKQSPQTTQINMHCHTLSSYCRLGYCWCIVALEETLKHVDTATVCAFVMSHMIKKIPRADWVCYMGLLRSGRVPCRNSSSVSVPALGRRLHNTATFANRTEYPIVNWSLISSTGTGMSLLRSLTCELIHCVTDMVQIHWNRVSLASLYPKSRGIVHWNSGMHHLAESPSGVNIALCGREGEMYPRGLLWRPFVH